MWPVVVPHIRSWASGFEWCNNYKYKRVSGSRRLPASRSHPAPNTWNPSSVHRCRLECLHRLVDELLSPVLKPGKSADKRRGVSSRQTCLFPSCKYLIDVCCFLAYRIWIKFDQSADKRQVFLHLGPSIHSSDACGSYNRIHYTAAAAW